MRECQPGDLRLLPGGRREGVGDDLFEGGGGGLPAEFVVDAGGVGGQVGGFVCGRCVAAGHRAAGDGFDGVDDVGDAAGLAAADVVGAPGAGLAGGEGAAKASAMSVTWRKSRMALPSPLMVISGAWPWWTARSLGIRRVRSWSGRPGMAPVMLKARR
jgi:hypothetical protein